MNNNKDSAMNNHLKCAFSEKKNWQENEMYFTTQRL